MQRVPFDIEINGAAVPGTAARTRRFLTEFHLSKEHIMDKDRINGAANQAKGAVKEAAGKITGDAKLQTEGKADKIKGKAQNAIGGIKDAARDALDNTP